MSETSTAAVSREGSSLGGLDAETRRALANELNALIADHYALELRTLVCRSRASGLHSHSLQDMLEQHASTLHGSTRKLAARVYSIGAATLSTLSDLALHQRLRTVGSADTADVGRMLELLECNQQLVEYIREAHALFDLHGDVTGARVIAASLEEAEQRSFQLLQIVKHT